MGLQTAVNFDQAAGVIGDIVINGPRRGKPGILRSLAATTNVIGRAAYHVVGDDLAVAVGAPEGGSSVSVFAGILANSKVYASIGTAAGGTLAPTLQLPNETNVELVDMSSGILVKLINLDASDPQIGWLVASIDATGELIAVADDTPVASQTVIPGVEVVRHNLVGSTANGGVIGIIQLT
jgi:hypothetical protein